MPAKEKLQDNLIMLEEEEENIHYLVCDRFVFSDARQKKPQRLELKNANIISIYLIFLFI